MAVTITLASVYSLLQTVHANQLVFFSDIGTLQGQVTLIRQQLAQLVQQGVQDMAALDDLKAADQQLQSDVTSLQAAAAANATAVQSAITLIQNLQSSGAISAADAEAVVADLQQAHQGVSNGTTSVQNSATALSTAAAPPAPPPGP